jgi:hypothetical protein
LVRLLDGDITVTSEITHGSTFTVYVPARYPPATTSSDRTFTRWGTSPTQVNGTDPAISPRTARSDAVTAGRPSAVHTEPRGTKVLVVDDDMCNIFALIALLERSAAQRLDHHPLAAGSVSSCHQAAPFATDSGESVCTIILAVGWMRSGSAATSRSAMPRCQSCGRCCQLERSVASTWNGAIRTRRARQSATGSGGTRC